MPIILIVEDDEEFQQLLEICLRREGYQIVSSLNGVDALYQASYHQPDLIILDLMMPWASGDAVLGFIRSTEHLKQVPVLVVSAHPEGAKLAHQLEADGFMPKPVDLHALREVVAQLLGVERPVG
jgi:CheY-like chemotaxis protein